MPNAELLLKEAERLSPECFTELLDFARFLGQRHGRSSTEEWPGYWDEAENARPGSVEPKLYSVEEFIRKSGLIPRRTSGSRFAPGRLIEKRSFAVAQGSNG